MKTKLSLAVVLAVALQTTQAFATLPRSAITNMSLQLFGVYTTSDPLCQTGLIATVPLTKASSTYDMTKSPTVGAGSAPTGGIQCVILIVRNKFDAVVAAGSYEGNLAADITCDGGVSLPDQHICKSQVTKFPAQVVTDAAAVGLTLQANCVGAVGTTADSEVLAMYLSVNSKCTQNSAVDTVANGCLTGGGNSIANPWIAPISVNDTAGGIHLTAPAVSSSYTFVVDPSGAFGNNSGSCQNTGAPLFSFHI